MDTDDLIRLSRAWDRAMVSNDADAIGEFMADDWVIVGPDGSGSDKLAFLSQVRSGALTHDTMTSEDLDVRLYGDTAVVLSRGVSGGAFQGQAFREHERASSVFVRRDGRWRCVLTHLSKLVALVLMLGGCYSRQVILTAPTDTPTLMRLTLDDGFTVRRFAAADSTVPLECRITRMDGRLDRVSGTTLFFSEANFGGVRPDGTRCSGPGTVYVVPPEHPALRMQVVRFDPLGSLMTAIIVAPLAAFVLYIALCAVEDCMG